MDATVISFADHDSLASHIANQLSAVYTIAKVHEFPDGESCVRIDPLKIRETVFVINSLYHPDQLVLPLLFLAETLRDYGGKKIALVAPYLAYMRQDKRFNEGEGISAHYFARLISEYFDGLVTVDPHLHRIKSLDEIYTIPSRAIHAAPVVADWIHNNIKQPLLIGPDSESEQWVKDLAQRAQSPYVVLDKIRHGDNNVEVSVPQVQKWLKHIPVLFDDIISTGRTMIETIKHLKQTDLAAPVCIGVHGIFSGNAYQQLIAAGAGKVVTTNTIVHHSNEINIAIPIVKAINQLKF
ncbi:MAG: ribose-phosphate diphosphokinase [Candidatus Dadabacteria bacterium]|nr:ribose-phosphate diphosphokinase [Candidatus Dadabacteria bacterium]